MHDIAPMTCIGLWSRYYLPQVVHVALIFILAHEYCWPDWCGETIGVADTTCESYYRINILRLRQNGRHFFRWHFGYTFFNENASISIKISLKFVPKIPINNVSVLVQIMVWRRPGAKPLSEPMMVRLPTHICVTRSRWFNKLRPRPNGRHFAEDILKCILLNENVGILMKISLNIVYRCPIDNKPALV